MGDPAKVGATNWKHALSKTRLLLAEATDTLAPIADNPNGARERALIAMTKVVNALGQLELLNDIAVKEARWLRRKVKELEEGVGNDSH